MGTYTDSTVQEYVWVRHWLDQLPSQETSLKNNFQVPKDLNYVNQTISCFDICFDVSTFEGVIIFDLMETN